MTAARTGKIGDGKIFLSRSMTRSAFGMTSAATALCKISTFTAPFGPCRFVRLREILLWTKRMPTQPSSSSGTSRTLYNRESRAFSAISKFRATAARRYSLALRLSKRSRCASGMNSCLPRARGRSDLRSSHSVDLAGAGSFRTRTSISSFCMPHRRLNASSRGERAAFSQELWDLQLRLSPATRTAGRMRPL